MHVVIENTVCLNAGDAAILIAIMKIIRETFGDDVQFSVFDSDPEIARRYYSGIDFYPLTTSLLATKPVLTFLGQQWSIRLRRNIDRIKRREFRRLLAAMSSGRKPGGGLLLDPQIAGNIEIYSKADMVISTGGTYLVERYGLDERIEEFEKDLALKKPLVLFTQSLGPFNQPKNKIAVKKVLDQAHLVLLRDARSEQYLRDIDITHDRLQVVADSVFALADIERLSAPLRSRVGERLRVAVSVRDWSHFEGRSPAEGMERYLDAVAGAVTALVRDDNAEVVFLSTCQGIPEYRYDDSAVGQRIFERLDDETRKSVSVDRAFHEPDELLTQLKGFDFVISTRMHMAILSLCAGVPVLPIAYEFKTTELYNSLSQGEWVTDISHIDRESFVALVRRFSNSLTDFYAKVAPYIIEQSRSARSAGGLIAAGIGASQKAKEQKRSVV